MSFTNAEVGLVARVSHLTKSFGSASNAVTALEDVSIGIRSGEFTAIMGPSGSGKSTLMHIMAGLDMDTSGAWLGNTEIIDLPDTELPISRRRRVGFVFQSFNLVPTLDLRGNILLPFELARRRPTPDHSAWIDRLNDSLGLGDRRKNRPHELSGGQQQRVAIARSLGTRPDLVFADEPTGDLDSRTGGEVLSRLGAASAEYGQSIAMVSSTIRSLRVSPTASCSSRMGEWSMITLGARPKRARASCSRWRTQHEAIRCRAHSEHSRR